MKQSTRPIFNMRAFVTLTATLSGLALPFSGFMNHLLQMDPMTVQRHAWMAAHNVLGVIFTAFVIWHAILNRRTLYNHIRGISRRLPFIRREAFFAISVIMLGLIYVGHAFVAH